MSQASLAKWLKAIILATGFCGLVLYFLIFPLYGQGLVLDDPELSSRRWAWLILIWVTAVPCYAVLALSWHISSEIAADRSFTEKNALLLKRIAGLALLDSGIFFVGSAAYLLLGLSHPGVALFSLLVVAAGIVFAVAAAALSHLVRKAADLRQENELTI